MGGIYFPTSSTIGVKIGNVTYSAEVRENGKIMAKMYGKWGTKDDLQKFLKGYWPGDLHSKPVKDYEIRLTLKITQYMGGRLHRILCNVEKPQPFYCNFIN